MGLALMQNYHVVNFSEDPESMDNWKFASKPDMAWLLVMAIGLVVLIYGFVGIWIVERRRKIWRINLHCSFPLPNHLSCSWDECSAFSSYIDTFEYGLSRLYRPIWTRQTSPQNRLVNIYRSRIFIVFFSFEMIYILPTFF